MIADIAGWATVGKFDIVTGISRVICGSIAVSGLVAVSTMDLLPMFRRCGTGPTTYHMRRIRPEDSAEWLTVTDPISGVPVSLADLLLRRTDVERFEDDHDLVRRIPSATGAGVTSPYDWDGMTLAVIRRIHDQGLPATQAELVAEMQDWFAQTSETGLMPDERTIRRRITPIWRTLRATST
ncbi:hypothetical protein U879_03990 [Defluviimonas sp. 20V17]|nr:hypothetical protein U879_03990 [Defluviimonas sp. 20V17]